MPGDWTYDGQQPNPRGSWRPDSGFTEAEAKVEGGVLERPDLVPDWLDAPTNAQHSEGVALLLNKKMEKALLEWKPYGLLRARFHSKYTKLTVLACYAPTNDSEAEDKDAFYDQFQAASESIRAHNMLLIIGDLNAKVGSDNTCSEHVMSKHGIGTINDNRGRLADFYGITKNQIDHVIINRKWRSSLQDVRAYRGADVASNHTLAIAAVSLKLSRSRGKQARQQRVDSGKLKDPATKRAFAMEVKNRFQALGDQQEMTIDNFNRVLQETGEKILSFQRNKKEQWIREETWKKIDERKSAKQKINSTRSELMKEQHRQRYTKLSKDVKKMTKTDKRVYIETLATEAEIAARKNDLKTLYKINKQLNNGFKNSDVPVKDMNSNVTEGETGKLQRWREHFEPAKPGRSDSRNQDNEERQSIRGRWNHSRDVESRCECDSSHTAWKTGLIFKLPKKGDLGDCNNWRGITLFSLTSKIVFSKIVLSRLTTTLEKDLRPQQAGFRPGRSCSEHIFIPQQNLEQSNEWNTLLYINFIDLEKAFDSIHRESLWKILRHYGVPAKLVQVIAMLYSDFKSQVVCDTELTDSFNVSTGVKQGCVLSPFLFILAIMTGS
ncbi:hypothetical protein C0Q70_10460 [Pomacea canaliculata]|uniref:Reverse transcriptase domain-containing protein n=1 Tax=Pomacea canaliculata TaxID=400727 RepID=A0A2T7P378_POMCA|nr:hypothetical protein C0Q70_10460 [Pomacea canaliculata]